MTMMNPDLKKLKRAIDRAVVATRTPPEPGMTSWPITLPEDHFTEADWRLLYDVVRHIRDHHNAVYRRFLYDRTVARNIVEYTADCSAVPTIGEVVAELRARASRQAAWMVEVPLANLLPRAEITAVGGRAVLVRSDSRKSRPRFDPHLSDPFAIRRALGDELLPRGRWLPASPLRPEDIDRRVFAALVMVEEGTEYVAASVAQSRAQLAVALWCLLTPPRRTERRRPLWPNVATWSPAPTIEFGLQRKPYEPIVGRGTPRRGNTITFYSPYRLTDAARYLPAPFKAMEKAQRGSDAALSILSAARSLYLAARHPNDLERTERLVHVWQAKEALCYPGHKGKGKSEERWERLVVNLRLRSDLVQKGYTRREINDAFEAARSLRDLTTHLPDDVLVNLNYPHQRRVQLKGGRTLSARSVGLGLVADDWPVLLAAVNRGARLLAKRAIQNGWNSRSFHDVFT